VVALQYFSVPGQWFAIELQDSFWCIAAQVVGRFYIEVKVTQGESQIDGGVIVGVL
jgi:hypothetical protein